MRYVSSWTHFAALVAISFFLMSCQKPLDLEAGLPQASNFNVTKTTAFPGVVKVISSTGYCSGTIVSNKAVLTAAHCTLQSGEYTVVGNFGSASTNTHYNFGTI
ncbi:hypothetical protein EBT16_07810 [bacterium]|nr:hypothetical protein [bacterium]